MSMRLLWVTQHYPPARGGMSTSCDRIVDGLRENGIVIDVAHFSSRHRDLDVTPKLGGDLLRIPLGQEPAHAMQRLWLQLQARKQSYSHIVAFGGPLPLRAAPVYSAWLHVPLFVLLRGNDLDVGIFSPRDRDVLERALQQARAVGVVAREHEQKVRALYPNVAVSFLPNGVESDSFQALHSDRRRAAAYREKNVTPGRQVLGLIGHLKAKKGALPFLQALRHSGCLENFHLRMVGEADESIVHELSMEAQRGGLSFTMEPFRDRWNLLEVYASLDWLVLPSLYDGMPNVLLEAMSMRVPVLSTLAGGIADVVEEGKTGYIFRPDDLPSARQALIRAAHSSHDARCAFGNEAHRRITGQFLASHETERYLRWFRDGGPQAFRLVSSDAPTSTTPPARAGQS